MTNSWNSWARPEPPPLPPEMIWHGRWVESMLDTLRRDISRAEDTHTRDTERIEAKLVDLSLMIRDLAKIAWGIQPKEPIWAAIAKQWPFAVMTLIAYLLTWAVNGHLPNPTQFFANVSSSGG